jgi:hypothetical protein
MARNMSYYMNSYITSEYIDHEVLAVVKYIAEALQKYCIRRYKGPHRALRCRVLDGSSELRLPADLQVLRWVTTRPHELTTTPAILGHICKPKDPQANLEQLKLSKTDSPMWS